MDKIKFDHSKETMHEAIGISDQRNEEIFETVKAVFLNDCDDMCKKFEQAIEELKPECQADYLLIGFKFAHIYHQSKQKEEAKIRRSLLSNLIAP